MDISLIFTAQGPGGIIALTALIAALVAYAILIRWIARAGRKEHKPWERMGWPFD